MEFKAKIKDGILEIYPKVEKKKNGDVIIYALNPALIQEKKNEILMKLAMGEKVELEKE